MSLVLHPFLYFGVKNSKSDFLIQENFKQKFIFTKADGFYVSLQNFTLRGYSFTTFY